MNRKAPHSIVRPCLALVSALLFAGTAGCGNNAPSPSTPASPRACTEIGCVDGFHLDLEPREGWSPGSYRFTVEADGQTTVCEGRLPLAACDSGPSLQCDGDGVSIAESGCALPPEMHGFAGIDLRSGPADVRVTVTRDGDQVASGAFQPEYAETQPNGPDCPPVCRQASARMEVAQPPTSGT